MGKFYFLFLILFFKIHAQAIIVGADNRRALSVQEASLLGLKPVVYLLSKKGSSLSSCTATWISKTHLITARHCVAMSERAMVYSEFDGYMSVLKAHVKRFFVSQSSSKNQKDWYGGRGQSDGRPHAEDWAILEIQEEQGNDSKFKLDENGNAILSPQGEKLPNIDQYADGSDMGFLSVWNSDSLVEEDSVKVGAYHVDADNHMYAQFCRYKQRSAYDSYRLMYRSGLMEFDCDMMSNASGAAIQICRDGKCGIVGIYSGDFLAPDNGKNRNGIWVPEFTSIYSNAAVKSENFINEVREVLRKDYSNVKTVNLKISECKRVSCLRKP